MHMATMNEPTHEELIANREVFFHATGGMEDGTTKDVITFIVPFPPKRDTNAYRATVKHCRDVLAKMDALGVNVTVKGCRSIITEVLSGIAAPATIGQCKR